MQNIKRLISSVLVVIMLMTTIIVSIPVTSNAANVTLLWPADSTVINSHYGVKRTYVNTAGETITDIHRGIDIKGSTGNNIYAAADGTIVKAEYNKSYGNHIVIYHPSLGMYTLYAHASKLIYNQTGTCVSAGQVIALIGATGNVTGPHLHFEVRVGENNTSNRVNPLDYLNPDYNINNMQPTATLSVNKSVYNSNDNVTFTFGGNNNGVYTFGIYKENQRIDTVTVYGSTHTMSFSQPGNYSAYMTAYGNNGGYADSNWIEWKVYPLTAELSTNYERIDMGQYMMFAFGGYNNSTHDTGVVDLVIYKDDVYQETVWGIHESSYSKQFNAPGFYSAETVAYDNNGGSVRSNKVYWTVYDYPQAPMIKSDKSTYNDYETITFNWNSCDKTDYYDLWIYKGKSIDDDVAYTKYYIEGTSHQVNLAPGEYYIRVASVYEKFSSWTWSNGISIIVKGHNCNYTEKVTPSTCIKEGSRVLTCTYCGKSKTETISKIGHTWRNWTQTKAPTCTENGEEKRSCSVCGTTETRVITAKGEHTWGNWSQTKAPTCTETGEEKRTCSVCGNSETRVITANGEHTWGNWTQTKVPTCTENGEEKRTCSVCGNTETRVVPAKGEHTWGNWTETKSPTCTENGEEKRSCSVCGATETRVITAKGEHTWGNWTETKAPTCIENGEEKRSCSVCGTTETRVVPAKGEHTWGNWTQTKAPTCTENGEEKRSCSVCGTTETRVITANGEHTWSNWTQTKAPTCTENGEEKRSCSVCGNTEIKVILSNGVHIWNEWETKVTPGCDTNGKKERKCKNCNITEEEILPAIGYHIWGEWVIIESTVDAEGSKTRTCKVCGKVEAEIIPKLEYEGKYPVEGGFIYYDAKTGAITDCDATVTSAVIPSTINGTVIDEIGDYAFEDCSVLESVSLPYGIREIGYSSFKNCVALKKITLPDSVRLIDHYAFYNCEMLEEVDMSDNIYSLGVGSFYSCDSLIRIEIPEGIERISEQCFGSCDSLYEVVLPESIWVIEYQAFSNCTALKEIDFPAKLTYIERYAFSSCSSLERIVLPKNIVSIDESSFSSCMSLKYIVIPDKVTTIERNAFSSCKGLEWVVIPVSMKTIEPGAFGSCSGIKEFRYCGDETQWQSVKTYSNINAPVIYNYSAENCNHLWSDWNVITEPTSETEGVEKRICSNCGKEETRTIEPIKPAITVNNYTVNISYSEYIKDLRYAPGEYTTTTEIRNAEGNVAISESLVQKYTVDGKFVYDMPNGGYYTVWIRMKDGTNYIMPLDVTHFTPYVSAYGVTVTIHNLYNVKDFYIAKGEFNTYREIKDNGYIFSASATKIAGKHDYTYTVFEPGVHTILIRYNDGTQKLFHETLVVDEPVFTTNGLQVTVSNLPDVKVIRTAYGEWNSTKELKATDTIRNFSAKTAIKGKDPYTIQYREEGIVTIIVEYNNGYQKVFHYNVAKKSPTVEQQRNNVAFGDLDGLVMVRYAMGEYTTSNQIKNAKGSKALKPDAIVDGKIVVENLAVGTYTFCVQYDDESFNYYVIKIQN